MAQQFQQTLASRVIICGASSTGKTTLANDWHQRHKDYEYIREIAREIMSEKSIRRGDLLASLKTEEKKFFFEFERLILEEQNRREVALASVGKPFISDRGPDPFVYVSINMGQEGLDKLVETSAAEGYLERCQESLVVLLCPLKEVTADDFRMLRTKEEQMRYIEVMRKMLWQHRIPHIYIDVADHKKRLSILEQSVRGTFPFETSLLDRYPLSVPFFLHRKPSRSKAVRTLKVAPKSLITKFTSFSIMTKTNRMVDRYGEDHFILVDFENRDVSVELVRKVLLKGVFVNGKEYQFLGCSSSGLKKRTCYMLQGSTKDVETILSECGDFSAIETVSKRLKQIGLLLSEAIPTQVEVSPEQVVYKEDIKSGGLSFTDGCGAVSVELAKRILEPGVKSADEKYLPSVLQICYEGCKGVVMVDPNLKGAKQLVIRESMKKFNPGSKPFQEIWLCSWSQSYSYGNLNCQIIMLFSALGVKDEVFLQKQKEYFKQLERMTDDPDVAARMLLWRNEPDLASRVAKYTSGSRNEFKSDQRLQNELTRLQNKLFTEVEKLHLLIPESRNVFGVCDPLNVLQYGECFFRPTVRGCPMTLCGKVTVAKNPCYLLGDVRVLTGVSDSRTQGLEHLVDCIVFPTQGKRPHPMEIAGSDLDGDQYFVCWDPDLIVPTVHEPYDYPSVEATSPEVSRKKTIEFFAQQKQTNVIKKIDRCFKYWANVLGVASKECMKLGMLFSQSVDATKTGNIVTTCIPPNLQPPKETTCTPDFSSNEHLQPVWQRMEDAARTCLCDYKKTITIAYPGVKAGVTEEFMWDLIQDKQVNISEFGLFQFVNAWCHNQPLSEDEIFKKLLEFSEYINFGKFTVAEQKAAIDMGIPQPMVTNALNKCKLLSPDSLDYFSLCSPHCGWHFYFRSDRVEFKWDHLLQAIQCHNESLIFFEISDGVTAGLHFIKKFETRKTELEEGSVVAYFFSTDFGYKLRHVLGPQYTLYLDSELLQLYCNKKQTQMFICLQSEITDEETVFDRISIDLTHFMCDTQYQHPLVNKECFQTIEAFVKNDANDPTSFDHLEVDQQHDRSPEMNKLLDELH